MQANPELLSLQDRWGLTALHSSAVAGGAEVIAVLLEARAELEAPSRSGLLGDESLGGTEVDI